MLDFHTHILPGIDDGSRDVQQSLEMLHREAQLGVTQVVATSHYYATEGSPQQYLRRRGRSWDHLRSVLTENLPQIRLGAEVQYFEGICAIDSLADLRIAGSKLLLLEMPTVRWSQRMLEDIIELNDREDIRVVMAHIDRYDLPKGLWEELANNGVLIQVNASVFTDWKTAGKAKKRLRNGQIHFVGSDCHNMTTRAPGWDQLNPKLFAEIEEITDHYARRLLSDDISCVY